MRETIRRSGLTREARAALTGVGLAVLLIAAFAIRFTTSATVGTSLASAATSTHPTQKLWVLHTGQTLGLVAAAPGLSVEQLNPYGDPGKLIPGQRIRLRATTPRPPRRP